MNCFAKFKLDNKKWLCDLSRSHLIYVSDGYASSRKSTGTTFDTPFSTMVIP
jgi:hypothetical protein